MSTNDRRPRMRRVGDSKHRRHTVAYSEAVLLPGLQSGEEVTLKRITSGLSQMYVRGEKETYKALDAGIGIPRVHWFGQECDYYVLVHDLLGPSFEDLLNYCGRRFSLRETHSTRSILASPRSLVMSSVARMRKERR